MLFNPLFLQVINNQESVKTKTPKLSNPSYLFSDIIKVSFENETQNSNGLGINQANNIAGNPTINIPIELKNSGFTNTSIENVLQQLLQQILPNISSESLQKTGITKEFLKSAEQSANDSGKVLFDQKKVYELISGLLNNKEFNGKAKLVINRQNLLQDNYSSALDEITKNEITPETLLDLLKMGNKISLESAPADKNLGLLITLIEHSDSQEDGADLSSLTGSPDYGIKNTTKKQNATAENPTGNSQDATSSGTTGYEIKISVIEQSANIDQINNFVTPELNLAADPENKIMVDIIMKDSASDANKNDLSALSKLPPPEQFFASTSVNTSELSKISSSFNKTLGTDAQQLKTILKGNETSGSNSTDILKSNLAGNTETAAAVNELLQDGSVELSSGTINQSGTGNQTKPAAGQSNTIAQEAESELKIFTDKSTQNNSQKPAGEIVDADLKTSPENNLSYVKLSDSIKAGFLKNTVSNPSVKSNQKNNPVENIPDKIKSSDTKVTGAQAEVKAEKSMQTESSAIKEQVMSQKVVDEKPVIKTNTENDQAEKISSPSDSKKPEIEIEKQVTVEVNKQTVKEDKKIISKDSSENIFTKKETEKNSSVNENSKGINTKVNPDDDKSKFIADEKINNSDTKKAAAKVVEEPINATAATDEKKVENPSAQAKAETTAKAENNESAKANQNMTDDKSSEDNKNQEKSMLDSNKNSDESKKAHDAKAVGDASFDKTYAAAAKDKVEMEKGFYSDAARTVKAAEVAKEIAKHIQGKENNTLYLKIDPEHLGTVKITVETVDKMVRANIEVENESARKLIENNLNQLYNNLNQNGVQLNSLNISLSNFEQKQGKAFTTKKKSFGYGEENSGNENDGTVKEKNYGYNTYEYTV